jgi:acetoin utilization protein AcuB
MKANKRIEEHMTEYPSLASGRTSVVEAAEFMKQMGIRHLPVVENKKIVGIISDRDLRQAELLSDSMTLVVSDFMTPDPYCVKVGTPMFEVVRTMADHKYGSAIILNNLDQVVGIFTTTDGMKLLALLVSDQGSALRGWGIERLLSGDVAI